MRAPFRSLLAAWLVRVALLLTGLAPLPGVVVCFEPDGSIALEALGGSRACEGCDESRPDQAPVRVVASAPSCCACLDIPLEGRDENACVPSSSFELPSPPAALVGMTSWAPCLALRATPEPRDGRLPEPDGTLGQLRTVVLRV